MERIGIAAAPGIAMGRAIVRREEKVEVMRRSLEAGQVPQEIRRFQQRIRTVESELVELQEMTKRKMGEEEAKIFTAHQLFLQDPEFVGAIEQMIESDQINAEAAVESVRDQFMAVFASMEDEYIRERAADLQDVSQRVLRHLQGITQQQTAPVAGPQILVVHDLTPSDTAQLDLTIIQGFASNVGGRTSHSAIMARTMGIPAVVGLGQLTEEVSDGDPLIVDGTTGKVYVRPEEALWKEYEQKLHDFLTQQETLAKLIDQPTYTQDGRQVELAANIGNPPDAELAIKQGAEGVGLFRTEFLYMGRDDLPTEEEQFTAYKSVLHTLGNRPVIIRTLDIGGDKELPYLELPQESNPFLGYRAIRLCLDQRELFKTQLRALLRASAYGNLKIMFPMIATLVEWRKAKQILEEVKQELADKKVAFDEDLKVGMMIEIPAAALIADQLAKEVDFFSIGTNDLIQYTMAADRMNPKVAYLYDPFNPSLLRLIDMVIRAAHREGKWVGMCGEMAGDELAIPILLGLGLDELSMGAGSILQARHLIKRLDAQKMGEAARYVLSLATGQEIREYMKVVVP